MLKAILALASVVMLGACHRLADTVERNADLALADSEGEVPIGVLLGHRNGPICIVLGELDEVHFSSIVPADIRPRIVDQLDAGPDGHMGVKFHLFDREGRGVDAMAIHWRNARLFVDTVDGPDLDVCFDPNDTVFVSKGEASQRMMALTYSLPAAP